MPRPKARPLPAPDGPSLQAAALAHLARFAATEQGLIRVLHRRIDRWARQQAAEPEPVATTAAAARAEAALVVARLAASGAVSDQNFAESRARSLARAGRSRRAIGAHLQTRGVAQALAASAVPEDPARELAAALIHARRRRMGPFRAKEATPEIRLRELASLARAGFAQPVARQALHLDRAEAELRITRFRDAL